VGWCLTRQENSALGQATVYWVWFDEPERDADGDRPFRGGQIHENALTLISQVQTDLIIVLPHTIPNLSGFRFADYRDLAV
jgi:hypothetical protein